MTKCSWKIQIRQVQECRIVSYSLFRPIHESVDASFSVYSYHCLSFSISEPHVGQLLALPIHYQQPMVSQYVYHFVFEQDGHFSRKAGHIPSQEIF